MERPLYFMIKPPSGRAASLHRLGAPPGRPPDRLHITLARLGDSAMLPKGRIAEFAAVADAVCAPPFWVAFNRLIGSGAMLTLVADEPVVGLLAFRRELIAALDHAGLEDRPPYRFKPHVTLDYRSPAIGDRAIDPFSWLVEDFVLVESVHGEGRHVEHGRWRLTGRRDEPAGQSAGGSHNSIGLPSGSWIRAKRP